MATKGAKRPAPKASTDLPKLSAPAHRALAGVGVSRLAELSKHTEQEIADLHGMGPQGMKELRSAMRAKGIKFAALK